MKCDDARSRLSMWMDGEDDSPELRAHIDACAECKARVERYRAADVLLRGAASDMVPKRSKTDAIRIVNAVMSAPRRNWFQIAGSVAAVFLFAVAAVTLWVNTRTPAPLDVALYAGPQATAGAPTQAMFLVRNHQSGAAVAGARIKAHVGEQTIEGLSDAQGVVNISFTAPESESATLTADVVTDIGSETLTHTYAVRRPIKVLITTDKPLYQPTQTVHARVLAMNTLTQKPVAGQEMTIEISDTNSNKVFRRTTKTSEFGSGAFDFILADELLFGRWRIRATVGGIESERTFEVKRYVLPAFKVEAALDRTFYAPGQPIKASIVARYFHGAPVANARVKVEDVTGRTDEQGRFEASIKLPKQFGTELARGDADVRLDVEVTDGADRTESTVARTVVSRDALKVWVLPEGGAIVKGEQNRFYIVTAYPDGALAKATLSFGDREIESDGVVVVTGRDLFTVVARDEKGATASSQAAVDTQAFIVRPDTYRPRAGQPLGVTAMCGFTDGTIYVDLVRDGITFVTKTMEVRGGKGQVVIDIPAEAAGTYQLSAYRVMNDATIERDTRTVMVEHAAGLAIDVKSARPTFAPGEEIPLEISVRDANGKPVVSEVALALVDEAVFALSETQPGFERVYFWIQEQLLTPKVQIKNCPPLATNAPVSDIRCAMAGTQPMRPAMLRGYTDRMSDYRHTRRRYNDVLASIALGLLLIAAVVGVIMGLVESVRRRSWGMAMAVASCAVIAVCSVPLAVIKADRAAGMAPDAAMVVKSAPPRTEGDDARVREDFPETLYWNPAVITDESGRASVTVPGADSITTWRVTASGVSKSGALGASVSGVRVFQDFFIDVDLPVSLTQGDVLSVPVVCSNYLKAPQDVTLRLETGPGFDTRNQPETTVTLAPNEVRSVYFKIRAVAPGTHYVAAFASSGTVKDAVRRKIEIVPDGKETNFVENAGINGPTKLKLQLPADAIDGVSRMWVRLYPSRLTEAVAGLEKMIAMPHG